MPNLRRCAAYPRALWRRDGQPAFNPRSVRWHSVAVRRVEAVAKRWRGEADVADDRGGAGDFCEHCDLGSAGRQRAVAGYWRSKVILARL